MSRILMQELHKAAFEYLFELIAALKHMISKKVSQSFSAFMFISFKMLTLVFITIFIIVIIVTLSLYTFFLFFFKAGD